jgi:spoIIIJ-associated protein
MKKTKDEAQALLTELFNLLGIAASFEITFDKENELLQVEIKETENAGLLIGKHGETLAALQSFLGIALRQKLAKEVRVVVNIGDWRQKQEEHLLTLAQAAAERAKATGEPQSLYNLKPYQRRIVHLHFAKDKEIETESVGEGDERYLVVKTR